MPKVFFVHRRCATGAMPPMAHGSWLEEWRFFCFTGCAREVPGVEQGECMCQRIPTSQHQEQTPPKTPLLHVFVPDKPQANSFFLYTTDAPNRGRPVNICWKRSQVWSGFHLCLLGSGSMSMPATHSPRSFCQPTSCSFVCSFVMVFGSVQERQGIPCEFLQGCYKA